MARVLTNEELRMIEEEMTKKNIARPEIAKHLKDMREYNPEYKIISKGINPKELLEKEKPRNSFR